MANCFLRSSKMAPICSRVLPWFFLIVSSRMQRSWALVLSAARQALEVLFDLLADVGVEGQERGALLDLVGGDRLVVDEHDDGLLALPDGAGEVFSAAGALGWAAACLGACRGCWAASVEDRAGVNAQAGRQGPQRGVEAACGRLKSIMMAGPVRGCDSQHAILPLSRARRAQSIHKTTVAPAWQAIPERADRGGMARARRRRTAAAVSVRSPAGPQILVSEHVVELVGLIVELAEVLELEAQHHGAVRPADRAPCSPRMSRCSSPSARSTRRRT